MIREILKMGDERLLRIAQPVPSELFGSEELQRLIDDMFENHASRRRVGLAAPQIGVDLQLVIFGFERSEALSGRPGRAADHPAEPADHPADDEMEEGWEGCLSVPGVARRGIAPSAHPLPGPGPAGTADRPQRRRGSMRGWCGTSATSPDRPPVSLANHRLQQVRLHRGAVPRPDPAAGRLSGCACGSAPAWLSSAGCRAAPPSVFFARFARRFSWAVFSGFLRVSFFAFRSLAHGVHLPTQHLRGAPDGRWRPRRRTAADASSIMRGAAPGAGGDRRRSAQLACGDFRQVLAAQIDQ